MKKIYTRMAACFMAALLTFNILAIPQAKASTTVTMLAPAVLAAYAQSVGVGLTASSAGAVSSGMTAAIGGYAAATGTTSAAVSGSIAAGAVISTSGAIILTVAACALLAGIVAWAVDEYGVEESDTPVEVYSASGYQINGQYFDPVVYTMWENSPVSLELGVDYTTGSGLSFRLEQSDGVRSFYVNDVLCNTTSYSTPIDYYAPVLFSYGDVDDWFRIYGWSQSGSEKKGVMNWDIGYNANPQLTFLDIFGPCSNDKLSVLLDPDYELPPEISEEKCMVIDTGITADDEQGIVDAILAGIADSSFAPTYTIEVDTSGDSGDDSGSDTGSTEEEKQTGFLGRIADGIDGLAESIKDGIGALFIPDAALTAEITNTFSEKFSFVSDLHRLGTDLLNLEPYTEPPVIYIHLEDAEGTINYGGTVKALDMSWYERYKSDGDRIIGGFLWLGFLWLLFKRAAAIIRGAEMVSDHGVDLGGLDAVEMFKADHNLDSKGRRIR